MGTKITIILYFSLSLQIKDVKARMIDQIIDYNKTFVAQKGYEKYLTIKTHPLAGLYTWIIKIGII